jgi:hypothetical protein
MSETTFQQGLRAMMENKNKWIYFLLHKILSKFNLQPLPINKLVDISAYVQQHRMADSFLVHEECADSTKDKQSD